MVAASEKPVPRLVIVDPAELRGTVLPLSRSEIVVGHSSTANLILDDSYVSRRHALITIDESGSVTIRDLNSVGGTFVNDVRLEGPHVLQRGDLVRFADLVTRFERASTPPQAASSPLDSPTRALPVPASAKTVPLAGTWATSAASQRDAAGGETAVGTSGADAAAAEQAALAGAVIMPPAPAAQPSVPAGPAVADLAPVLGAASSQLIAAPRRSRDQHPGRRPAGRESQRPHSPGAGRRGSAHRVARRPGPAVIRRHRQCRDHRRRVHQHPGDRQGPAGARSSPPPGPSLGEAGATSMQLAAVAMYRMLDQLIIGAHIDAGTGNGTGFSPDLERIIIPPDLARCLCEDCQAAPSPTAYLADLLSYVTSRLLDKGEPVSLPYLVANYYQPFADLPTDCAAVETQVRQVRICAEVLNSYLQDPAHAPAAAQQQALATATASYLLSTYETLLTGLGTSYDEVRLARAASPADRSSLAGRLGLTVNPYAFDPDDALDQIVLDPTVAPPGPRRRWTRQPSSGSSAWPTPPATRCPMAPRWAIRPA